MTFEAHIEDLVKALWQTSGEKEGKKSGKVMLLTIRFLDTFMSATGGEC